MATLSSHILNGVDGTHAGGICVTLFRLEDNIEMFSSTTDEGGRLSQVIDLADADANAIYQLVFETGLYWKSHAVDTVDGQIIEEVVLRFKMPDNAATYHRPIILSPNAYSLWASG